MRKKLLVVVFGLWCLALPAFAQFKGTNGVAFFYVGSLAGSDVFIVGRPGVTNFNVATSNMLRYLGTVASGPVTLASGIFASKTNYTDRVEATNSSTLTLFGGGAEAALESGQFKVRSPYYFGGLATGLTGIPWAGLTGIPAGFADGTDDGTAYTNNTGLPGVIVGSGIGTNLATLATDAEVAAGYQPLDADLTDLADGSLTGSLVGSGIAAGNITTGTVGTARLGSGTANSGSYLRGDQTWQAIAGGADTPWTLNHDFAGFAASNIMVLRGRNDAGTDGEVRLETHAGNSMLYLTNTGGARLFGNLHVDGYTTLDDGLTLNGTITAPQLNATAATIGNAILTGKSNAIVGLTAEGNFTNASLSELTYSGNVLAPGSTIARLASPTFTGTVVLPSGQALIAPALGTIASGNGAALTSLNPANLSVGSATLNTITVDGLSARTNLFTINGTIGLGTNYTYTGGAATWGITGVNNAVGSVESQAQLTIKSTGDIIFTNPVAFYASDGLDTRTFTNGNLTTVIVHRIPGFSTNLVFSWSK